MTNRPGTRHGPREIRNQSSLIRLMNQATGVNPHEGLSVADIGDAWVEKPYDMMGAHQAIGAHFQRCVEAGGPVGMVHFDAHCDAGGDYLGSKFHHGSPFRAAVEEGVLDPKRVCQIGIRGSLSDPEQWKFSHETGMRVIYMEEFTDMGWHAAVEEAIRVAGTGRTHVSFDVDGLDPVYAPGTGTPEAGGITMIEAQRMVRELSVLDLVGADIVECSPPFDVGSITSLNAATLMFELLCVVSEAVRRRK